MYEPANLGVVRRMSAGDAMKLYIYKTNRKVKVSPHLINLLHNEERKKWWKLEGILNIYDKLNK